MCVGVCVLDLAAYSSLPYPQQLSLHLSSSPPHSISCSSVLLQLKVEADAQCEASYFNERVSAWEPLLEPLENNQGKLNPWNIHIEVREMAVNFVMHSP